MVAITAILEFIKKYWKLIVGIVLIGAIIALGVTISSMRKTIKKYKENYDISMTNNKAYQDEINGLTTDKHVYELTIDELRNANDSISQKIKEVQKELEIKDKELAAASYSHSTFVKHDTIRLTDTIFKEETFAFDTIIRDSVWYKLSLSLAYPSTIVVNPEITSEKLIYYTIEKETIEAPKKCWLARLFQKKHRVLKVQVKELNPYITEDKNRFIEIIKKK